MSQSSHRRDRRPCAKYNHRVALQVQFVLYPHVELCCDSALFVVPTDVQIAVGAPVGESVDQTGLTVEGEDDVFIGGEQRIVISVGQAVGMLTGGL